jgi:outer membrane protein assembly factor BamB
LFLAMVALVAVSLVLAPALAGDREEAFWEAAKQGDLATIKRLIGEGVDVNARTDYGATALSFACDREHLDVVRYLVEQGADVNSKDDFYEFTPLGWVLFKENAEIAIFLLKHGAEGADRVLATGVRAKNKELVTAALESPEIDSGHVALALEQAKTMEGADEIVALLEGAEVKPSDEPQVEVNAEVMQTYVGRYKNDEVGLEIAVRVEEKKLVIQATGQPSLDMRPLSESKFTAADVPGIDISFAGRGGLIERLILEQGGQVIAFPRVVQTAEAAPEAGAGEAGIADATGEAAGGGAEAPAAPDAGSAAAATPAAPAVKIVSKPARNWPGFRGPGASGVADGQGAPVEWDVKSGKNVRWKTPIPGMANSSPIVWKDRIFVTTALSTAGDDTFRSGLYGDVDSVDDTSEHVFKVYALSRVNGEILWERTAASAVPGAKRHMKSTQANSTPVTDGKRVVALFGTIGLLVAYDLDGKPLWKTDVGVLDAGWFYDASYQWGHASSPVIYKDLVIVQADVYKDSFIAAYRLSDGKQAWKQERESIPSWGSPTVYQGEKRHELITNGNTIKGYDPATGKELWSLAPNSEVTVATPIVAHDLFYVTAGYPPVRPVYAIRPGGDGDISLPEGSESSPAVAWSKSRGGTYIPTPIVYGDYLYTCANDGRMRVYKAKTGEEVYRERVGGGGTFTASPIATDGRLYFTTEEGQVIVVKAGPEYEELVKNEMGEICMSTPAISDGLLVVRTLKHVYGLGEPVTR